MTYTEDKNRKTEIVHNISKDWQVYTFTIYFL